MPTTRPSSGWPFSSDRHTALEITDFADRYVEDRLQSLNGRRQHHHRRPAPLRDADLARTRPARRLPVIAPGCRGRLNHATSRSRAGRIESREREFSVVTETDFRTPEQFNDLIIRQSTATRCGLRDIGRAELGAEDERNAVRVNGRPAVGLGVVKQSTANTLEVAQAVKAELPHHRGSAARDATRVALTARFHRALDRGGV